MILRVLNNPKMGIDYCTGVFWVFFLFYVGASEYRISLLSKQHIPVVQHLRDPTPRVSHSVGLGWDPRICISNQLPGDANGDAAGPGTTITGSHHLKITCGIFWEFCFKCTPSRRENTEIAKRKEQKKWQQNVSFMLQEGSC